MILQWQCQKNKQHRVSFWINIVGHMFIKRCQNCSLKRYMKNIAFHIPQTTAMSKLLVGVCIKIHILVQTWRYVTREDTWAPQSSPNSTTVFNLISYLVPDSSPETCENKVKFQQVEWLTKERIPTSLNEELLIFSLIWTRVDFGNFCQIWR